MSLGQLYSITAVLRECSTGRLNAAVLPVAVDRLEKGTSNPTLDVMARLTKALAVSFKMTPMPA